MGDGHQRAAGLIHCVGTVVAAAHRRRIEVHALAVAVAVGVEVRVVELALRVDRDHGRPREDIAESGGEGRRMGIGRGIGADLPCVGVVGEDEHGHGRLEKRVVAAHRAVGVLLRQQPRNTPGHAGRARAETPGALGGDAREHPAARPGKTPRPDQDVVLAAGGERPSRVDGHGRAIVRFLVAGDGDLLEDLAGPASHVDDRNRPAGPRLDLRVIKGQRQVAVQGHPGGVVRRRPRNQHQAGRRRVVNGVLGGFRLGLGVLDLEVNRLGAFALGQGEGGRGGVGLPLGALEVRIFAGHVVGGVAGAGIVERDLAVVGGRRPAVQVECGHRRGVALGGGDGHTIHLALVNALVLGVVEVALLVLYDHAQPGRQVHPVLADGDGDEAEDRERQIDAQGHDVVERPQRCLHARQDGMERRGQIHLAADGAIGGCDAGVGVGRLRPATGGHAAFADREGVAELDQLVAVDVLGLGPFPETVEKQFAVGVEGVVIYVAVAVVGLLVGGGQQPGLGVGDLGVGQDHFPLEVVVVGRGLPLISGEAGVVPPAARRQDEVVFDVVRLPECHAAPQQRAEHGD
ncbi:MAG: hypothetical protein BWZ02_03006 [Lentisphaerae bacterium ADurb.BinA184]|nr:MAG: hypothetical protein BWZ02_03006 [Lentisphaerae bacterium ADurb.BinA184]